MTVEVGANRTRGRYCSRGHDKEVTGRVGKSSDCLLCAQARKARSRAAQRAKGLNWKTIKKDRDERRGDFKWAFQLPAEPLRAFVNAAVARIELAHAGRSGSFYSGLSELSRRYAQRFGTDEATAERMFYRLRKQQTVTIEQGDQIAIFLGLHPVMIWPHEWVAPADTADDMGASA